MTKMFLSNMIIMLSIIMFFMNNPLSMGLMILMQTLLICLLSGMMIKTYWFSYILFLTFLGGLLVLFIYVSSIASNELFNMKFLLNLFFLFVFEFIFNNPKFWCLQKDLAASTTKESYVINLDSLLVDGASPSVTMLLSSLFSVIHTVLKIAGIFYGPLRSSF
uniref:NADH-ubiquinone oxidoreductase chain 6 n=1 Tax=Phalera flavescens TaxID=13634 RepID=G4WW77_PHAFA|nr:NADH dehydrogenase subunit 6 [Phalera flavescens]AEB71587.1 NADH dehydrogenase subunit 6 [Phalera flavescens]